MFTIIYVGNDTVATIRAHVFCGVLQSRGAYYEPSQPLFVTKQVDTIDRLYSSAFHGLFPMN